MNDADVGKLWDPWNEPVRDLIIKLVQDRYCVYDLQGHPDPLAKALREFGIDYQEYLTVKEATKK